MNSRRESLFLFSGFAVIVGITFVLFSEPRYESKTAWQWFKERLKERIDEEQYAKAVLALHTNFHDVLVELPSRLCMPSSKQKNGMYEEFVRWMQMEVFKSYISDYKYRDTLRETAALLHQSEYAADEFEHLRAALKNPVCKGDKILYQKLLLTSIYMVATGDKEGKSCIQHLGNTIFLVRLRAAQFNKPRSGQIASAQERLSIPVFDEAITNKNLLAESFGMTGEIWCWNTSADLRRVSREKTEDR